MAVPKFDTRVSFVLYRLGSVLVAQSVGIAVEIEQGILL